MTSPLDEIVITEGNRDAFETILAIGSEHESPVQLYVWGPVGSGKTTVLRARGREKDLLSTQRIISCHAGEIIAILRSGVNEEFLDKIGEVDILLIDGFEQFLQEGEVGTQVCTLLLTHRSEAGLHTVLASDIPPSEIENEGIKHALEGFTVVEVSPLDEEGLTELAHRIQTNTLAANAAEPIVSDDVIAYIVGEFAETPEDVANAMRFLVTQYNPAEEGALTVEKARQLLSV